MAKSKTKNNRSEACVFRLRVLLRATRRISLRPFQGGQLYGFLCEAFALGCKTRPGIPDGVMLDAPELSKTRVEAGELYAFGLTFVGFDVGSASLLAQQVVRGMRKLSEAQRGPVLAGNYRVEGVFDLAAGRVFGRKTVLVPIERKQVVERVGGLGASKRLTLRFDAPLRLRRPRPKRGSSRSHNGSGKRSGGYVDGQYFDAAHFFRRLIDRLRSLGLEFPGIDERLLKKPRVIENRLVWVDLRYKGMGPKEVRGGAIGWVELDVKDRALLEPLIWGSLMRVGQNPKFGFGSYSIDDLPIAPWACLRSRSLLEAMLEGSPGRVASLERTTRHAGLASGILRHARTDVLEGRYRPRSCRRILIPASGGRARILAIPDPLDRALQRLLLDRLSPALDAWFEESSFAYRKGLCRVRAAKALKRAAEAGYTHALEADFHRFFDSVDHRLLEARLMAHLQDRSLVDLLMAWVQAGAPQMGLGLPTGAPISPVLANLFLDSFDEQVHASGGRLVRYADDFVILYRTRQAAQHAFEEAKDVARRLRLALNASKSRLLDTHEPFCFLGFEFTWHTEWKERATGEPTPIAELGWRTAVKLNRPDPRTLPLPGETGRRARTFGATVIVEPGATELAIESGKLVILRSSNAPPKKIHLERIRELVIHATPRLDSGVLRMLFKQRSSWILLDPAGEGAFAQAAGGDPARADVLIAQVKAYNSPTRRLAIACTLVRAKLANYAALAQALGMHDLAQTLRRKTQHASSATTLQTLLGIEGSAARAWYARYPEHLPSRFHFHRRVAPGANDPVNALLNLAFTILHQHLHSSIQRAGLAPTLGFLHSPRRGHAALASDLQEPFRPLVERTVLAILQDARQSDFRRTDDAPHRLRISTRLRNHLTLRLFQDFSLTLDWTQREASYHERIDRQCRSLRRALLFPPAQLEAFTYPDPSLHPAIRKEPLISKPQ